MGTVYLLGVYSIFSCSTIVLEGGKGWWLFLAGCCAVGSLLLFLSCGSACLLLLSFFFPSSISSSFLQWITCTGSGGQGSPFLALDSWRGWALMGEFFMHTLCKHSRGIMDFSSSPHTHTHTFFLSFFSLPLFLSPSLNGWKEKKGKKHKVTPPLTAIFDWLLECWITVRVLCSLAGWFASYRWSNSGWLVVHPSVRQT